MGAQHYGQHHGAVTWDAVRKALVGQHLGSAQTFSLDASRPFGSPPEFPQTKEFINVALPAASDAIMWAVTLHAPPVATASGQRFDTGTWFDSAIVDLQFGTLGNAAQVLFNWPLGGTYLVHGQSLSVKATMVSPFPTVAGLPTKVTLGAHATPLVGGAGQFGQNYAAMNVDIGAVAAGGNVDVVVPAFAEDFRVLSDTSGSAFGVITKQYDMNKANELPGRQNVSNVASNSFGVVDSWWPVHPACRVINVTNTAGSAWGTAQAMFRLRF